jgi:raffinose/stachyose/melibiose transport system permease protein
VTTTNRPEQSVGIAPRTRDLAGRADARPAGPRPAPRPVTRQNNLRRKWLEIGLFSAPALVVYVMFVILPIGFALYYSFYKWNGIEPLTNFIGLDNYKRAFSDTVFLHAMQHNLFVVVGSIALQLPVALAIALLLNRRFRGRKAFRLLAFVPYVVSEVITGVMWLLVLQPDSLADRTMESAGLGGWVQLWLADRSVVMWTLLFILTWKYIGFAIILFLAGLQNVPTELYEAAAIDGATWWQSQRLITIPLLAPTIRIWIFLSMIGSLQLFDVVWVLTGGGPANASATMATYMINYGFYRSQFGYGSAVAVILFVISFIAASLYQRFVLRRDTEGALTRRVG